MKKNLAWKSIFSSTMLQRGRNYRDNGHIKDFHMTEKGCSALVVGSDIYRVRVENPGENNMRIGCTCPYAAEGYACKHMAAVMLEWESRKHEAERDIDNPNVEDPFALAEGEKVPFFCMSRICSELIIRQNTINEAQELIKSGIVKLISFEPDENTHRFYEDKANIKGSYGNVNENVDESLFVIVSRNRVIAFECSHCGSYYHGDSYYYQYREESREVCPHILALLMLADEYSKKYDPGDITDYAANRFLNNFGRRAETAETKEAGKAGSVTLEPRIVETISDCEVNFRIGNGGKMYVVKNLTNLCNTVEKGGVLELGKNASIDFANECFEPMSARLYELIDREVKRAKAIEKKMEFKRSFYYDGTLEAGKGVPFVGDVADTIYEIYDGKTIEFKPDGARNISLEVKKTEPRINIKIDAENDDLPDTDEIVGIRVSGKTPQIIEGVKNSYFLSLNTAANGIPTHGVLSEIEDNTRRKLAPFVDATGRFNNKFDFVIGKKRATEFYYNILSKLKDDDAFNIVEDDRINTIIKDKAEFTFYLDVVNNYIVCKTRVSYGETEFKLKHIEREAFPLAYERDSAQEMPVRIMLMDMFDAYAEDIDAYVAEDDEDRHYEILRNGVPILMEYGEVQSTDAFSKLRFRKSPVARLGVALESNLLDLTIKTDDIEPEELVEILNSYTKKKKYHRLRNGEYVDLEENQSIYTLSQIMDNSGISIKELAKGNIQIPAYRTLYLEKMLEEHDELVADRDRKYRKLIRDFKTVNDADYELPDSLKEVLRPYQEHGFKWLKTLETAGFGGILADDMGLGKTLQVIAVILQARETAEASEGNAEACTLVVCPASLVYNWTEEIERFAPQLKAIAIAGTKSERRNILSNYKDYDVLVTSYDLLKRDIDLYEDLQFAYNIIDEAQFIKNAGSQAAKSVKLIHSDHRFALTGTPIENRLSELWSIFDFLMPGFLYRYERFRKEFETPISKNKDDVQMEVLRNIISPFVLRRKKADVLKDLPDKLEEIYYAKFDKEQQKLYDAQLVRTKGLVESKESDFDTSKIEILAELTRLRQLCCDPSLLLEDYAGSSAKREACLDLVRSAIDGGHKVLLFSQFTSMFELLEKDLKAEGIEYYKLTGATPKEERIRMVKAFNGNDTPLFLISLKAGGTGLNLTGADVVIHYDPWWNQAAQDQASDRAHRIGQTNTVTVYQLIVKDSIEERIVELQRTKKELSDAILSGETRSIGSMTKEELLALLA